MITLSNKHRFEHMVPSGAFGFNGKGWLWDWPLMWLGLIDPDLFTIVMRTITRYPRLYPKSNLSWIRPWTWLPWSPWSCIRFLPDGGTVNRVGLYNPGFDYWCEAIAPTIDFDEIDLVGSIHGDRNELVEMATGFNQYGFVAIEANCSCPNTEHPMEAAKEVISMVKAIYEVTIHPIIVKVSVDQDYMTIIRGLEGIAQAISLNSVPHEIAYPSGQPNPLRLLQKRLGGKAGGVSGKPAQKFNWRAVQKMAELGTIPVIGPSVKEYEDLGKLRGLGAKAISYGEIHIRTPWKPTSIVRREMKTNREFAAKVFSTRKETLV